MKIEIWSDYACPYCYIGKRKLEKALENFPEIKSMDIIFKSFELDPNAVKETVSTTLERVMKKYSMSALQTKEMIASVTAHAMDVGLEFHYDTVRYTNTFDAHRITKYAESKGKGREMIEKLFHAYFNENKQMSDFKVLTGIAGEIGLDIPEVQEMLSNNQFAANVRMDETEAQRIGIHAVPYIVINEKYAVSGAQSPEVFIEIIKKVLNEQEKDEAKTLFDGMICNSDGCIISN